ncbi:hypothetical protein SAMD00019534_016380, partial [Acytostelium subglobosum LB1]|uniref:hypothetical protein n=1 Tax=Acytostelium subglobosum LB1 TaxID=1410327 RepID=UPI000645158C
MTTRQRQKIQDINTGDDASLLNQTTFHSFVARARHEALTSCDYFKLHTSDTDRSIDNLYEEFHICMTMYDRTNVIDVVIGDDYEQIQTTSSLVNELDFILETLNDRSANIPLFAKEISQKLIDNKAFIANMQRRVDTNDTNLKYFKSVLLQAKRRLVNGGADESDSIISNNNSNNNNNNKERTTVSSISLVYTLLPVGAALMALFIATIVYYW